MGVTNPMGGMPDISSLSDAQLAAVVQAVNQGEIDEGQLALSRSTSPEVKRFARDMVGAHRDMQNKTSTLLDRLQLTPSENAVSNQLKSDTHGELQDLQTMRGKDFDHDYIDAQVRNHNKALEVLERITPGVKNVEFKTALINLRPKIEAHLRAAERVQEALQRGATSSQPAMP
jgi:putative membrane protein